MRAVLWWWLFLWIAVMLVTGAVAGLVTIGLQGLAG